MQWFVDSWQEDTEVGFEDGGLKIRGFFKTEGGGVENGLMGRGGRRAEKGHVNWKWKSTRTKA